MTRYTKWILFFGVVIILITLLADVGVEARGGRGGRGGGFRSGFRSSRSYRSRSRSRNTYASRVRSTLRSRFFNWKTAAVAGSIYGWHRYSRSPRYYSNTNYRPTICVNLYDYKSDNGTLQDMFICPLYTQGEDYKYCCGPEDRQKCCRYWDKGGNVAGVVIGILLLIGIIVTVVCCCCLKTKKQPGFIQRFSKRESGAKYTMTNNQQTPADMAPSYPQKDVQPPEMPPYPPTGAEPGYPPATTPYPPQPDEGVPYPFNSPMPDGQMNGEPYPPAQQYVPPYPPQQPGEGLPYPPAPQPAEGLPYPPAVQPNTAYPSAPPPPYASN